MIAGRVKSLRGEENFVAEAGVLPADVDFDILRPVPVDPGVDGVELVGPHVGIGEAGGEDLTADIEVVVAGRSARSRRTRVSPVGCQSYAAD